MANWELGFEGKHELKEHSLVKLKEQWKVSKELLPKLKYNQVHSATFESGILENDTVLNQLFKIKAQTGLKIGISTSGVNQNQVVEAALKIKVCGHEVFDSFQVTYNVFEQSTFSILTEALKQGKTIIIKEALANGRVFQNKKLNHYQFVYNVLERLSKKYNVGVDAIAIRFVMDNLQPNFVLSGASNRTQLAQNLEALNFKFTQQELQLLKTLKASSKAYWSERSALNWN